MSAIYWADTGHRCKAHSLLLKHNSLDRKPLQHTKNTVNRRKNFYQEKEFLSGERISILFHHYDITTDKINYIVTIHCRWTVSRLILILTQIAGSAGGGASDGGGVIGWTRGACRRAGDILVEALLALCAVVGPSNVLPAFSTAHWNSKQEQWGYRNQADQQRGCMLIESIRPTKRLQGTGIKWANNGDAWKWNWVGQHHGHMVM